MDAPYSARSQRHHHVTARRWGFGEPQVYDANGNVVEELHPSEQASDKTTVTKTARLCWTAAM